MNTDARLLLEFVEQDFGIRGSGNYYRALDHDSLVVDTRSGVFFWNSKGIFGKPLDYLTKVRRMRFLDAKELLKFSNGKVPIYVKKKKEDVPLIDLVDVFFNNGVNNRDYFYNRLLTDETINKFKLGYHNGWSTVPILEKGKLLNIQLRRDIPEKRVLPYYKTKPVLYNADLLNKISNVVICEGIVDSILLNQLGIPAISKLGGAMTWLTEWFEYFIGIESIYLVFDNDDAGRKGAKRVAKELGLYRCKIFTFNGFREKYDIIDYFRDNNNIDNFIRLLKTESQYAFKF